MQWGTIFTRFELSQIERLIDQFRFESFAHRIQCIRMKSCILYKSIFSSSLIRQWPWSDNEITVSIWVKFCYLFSTKYHKALHPAWKKYTSHLFPHCILNLDAQALSMLQGAFPTLRWEHISQIELFGFHN